MSQSPHMSLIDTITPESSANIDTNIDTNHASQASIGKVVCVGRNYAAHAHELDNEVPKAPILFMKPASAIVSMRDDIIRPDPAVFGDTHYEAELCIQLSADLSKATIEQAQQAIGGVTLGLDLTLRELQSTLKAAGHPWERAKCFDGACVLGDWVEPTEFGDFTQVNYQLVINDKLTQEGDTQWMLFSVYELLVDISHAFSLQAGDVVMTGTPSGVGILHAGDTVILKLNDHKWLTKVQ